MSQTTDHRRPGARRRSRQQSVRFPGPGSALLRAPLLALALAALTLWSGCEDAPTPAPPLVLPGELAAFEGELATEPRSPAPACARAPLRGTAMDGEAQADLLRLTEPQELRACANLARARQATLADLLFDPAHSKADPRTLPWAPSLQAPTTEPQAATLRALGEACVGLQDAVTRAAQHGDACSPYRLGARALEDDTAFRALSRTLVALARELARTDPPAAIAQLFDLLRVGQDLGRGEVPWAAVHAGLATVDDAVPTLERILAQSALPEADARRLAGEAAALLASDLEAGPVLFAERQVIDRGLAALKEGAPPGAAPAPLATVADDQRLSVSLVRPEHGLIARLAVRQVSFAMEKECRATPTGGDCIKRAIARTRLFLSEAITSLEWIIASESPAWVRQPREARKALEGVLRGLVLVPQLVHLGELFSRRFFLASLQLHLAVRAKVRAGEALSAAKLADYAEATDPLAQGPMLIEENSPGHFWLRTTASIGLVLPSRHGYLLSRAR